MFKLTSIFPPLSLSGSSTYSSFTLQREEQTVRARPPSGEAHLYATASDSSSKQQGKEQWRRLSRSNFPPLTSSAYPLSLCARLTHCCAEPISCPTSDRNHRVGFVVTGTPAGAIERLRGATKTGGYLHFSCNESGQLRQEQEENEDAAEDGNCRQTHTGVSIN